MSRALRQLVTHPPALHHCGHRLEDASAPRRVRAFAVGEDVEALRVQFLEKFRAPALAIEDHGDPTLADQAPDLGQDLAPQHRDQIIIGGGRDDEQGLRVLLIHPDIGRGRQAEPAPRAPGFRQRMRGPVIGPHVAVHVEQAHGLGVVADPALRQPLAELCGLSPRGQLPELAAQGLHLGRAVEPQQHPEFARRMPVQLLRGANPQQRHERQDQQRRPQTIEALLQRAVGLFTSLKHPQRQQRRQCQQGAAVPHRLGRHKLRGRLGQVPQPGQRPFEMPLHGHATRRPRIALAPRRGAAASGPAGCASTARSSPCRSAWRIVPSVTPTC